MNGRLRTQTPARRLTGRRVTPLEALLGKARVVRALEAVVGMWSDRQVDPVGWQRKLRAEWEKPFRRHHAKRATTRRR